MTACNLPSNAAPTEVFAEEAPTASMDVLPTGTTVLETAIPAMTNTAASAPARGVFTLSILVDTTSEPVTREQAQVLVDEASAIFERLTGFTLEMVDFREYNSGMSSILGNYFNDPAYVRSDGIIIFSYGDNGDARLYGGYAFEVPGSSGFVSRFNSPYTDPNSVYVSVVLQSPLRSLRIWRQRRAHQRRLGRRRMFQSTRNRLCREIWLPDVQHRCR